MDIAVTSPTTNSPLTPSVRTESRAWQVWSELV
jgi:hypothetical protein